MISIMFFFWLKTTTDLFALTVAIKKKEKMHATTFLWATKRQTFSTMYLHKGVPQDMSEINLNEHFGLHSSWVLNCTFGWLLDSL